MLECTRNPPNAFAFHTPYVMGSAPYVVSNHVAVAIGTVVVGKLLAPLSLWSLEPWMQREVQESRTRQREHGERVARIPQQLEEPLWCQLSSQRPAPVEPVRPTQQGHRPPCGCTATVESTPSSTHLDLGDQPLRHDRDADNLSMNCNCRT